MSSINSLLRHATRRQHLLHDRFRSPLGSLLVLLMATCLLGDCGAVVAQTASAQADSSAYRQALAKAVRNAANRVLDSVVSIEVIGVAETAGAQGQADVASDAPTCGVVVDAEGYIIASDLVVKRPSASVLVVLPDGARLAAEVISRDHHRGLVLLRVRPEAPLAAVSLADASETKVGETVVAVGRYGGDHSPMVSSGILSATGRLEGTMLQTDARVSPSFYGGPLIDLYGRAIGITVPAVAEGGAPDDTSWYDSGIAFAVPTTVLAKKLPRLRDGDDIRKGLIGIVPATKDPYAEGTRLAAVRTRSPAEKAGIQPGDQVQSVAGQPVRMFQEIKQALGPYDAGETIELELRRDGTTRTVSVTLAESIPPLQPQRLGIWVDERGTDEAQIDQAGNNGGDANSDEDPTTLVVRGVVPGSAAELKLEVGDEIVKLDETDVRSLATLRRLLTTASPETSVVVSLRRDGQPMEVTVTPRPIGGPLDEATIPEWRSEKANNAWDVQELRLPDVTNLAAYTAPEPGKAEGDAALGMLVLLLSPDKRDPAEALQGWREVSTRMGVVVCAVCSADEKRWQQNEVDVVSRMATMLAQRVPVNSQALAASGVLEGVGASAADSMVLAIAVSDRKNFSGVAISEDTKPPAVRLRENEPDHSLGVLLPIKSLDEGPTWLAPLERTGYPIILGGQVKQEDLLRWVRLLQTI